MSETSSMTPEMQEMLPKAAKEVVGLYLGDQLGNLLRTQLPEQRDQFWREAAQKFGPFSEKITELRQALKNAYVTKEAYDEHLAKAMHMYFADVDNPAARELLIDLLFARIIVKPGYIDYSMNVVDEAEAMASELGIGEGLGSEAIKSVDLDRVVEAVLSGRLKVTRQTQLEKK